MAVFGLYSAGQDKQAIAAAQAINQASRFTCCASPVRPRLERRGKRRRKFNLLKSYLPEQRFPGDV